MRNWAKRLHFRADPALLVIGAGVVAALHVGKLSPAIPVLSSELGISLIQAGFLLSLVQLAGMFFGLAVGLGADSLGLRRSLLIGLFTLTTASCTGAFAQSVEMLLTLRAVEGFGFLLIALPAPGLIRQLVPSQKLNVSLGLWGAYMPLGTALALLTGPFVIELTSWRVWWLALSVVSLFAAIWVWRVIPQDGWRHQENVQPTKSAKPHWRTRLMQTITSPGPWLVSLTFAVYSGQWLAVIGFLPSIYAQTGFSASTTALLTALVAAVNVIGNVVSGRLLRQGVAAHRLLYVGFLCMGLGTFLAFVNWPMQAAGGGFPASLRFAGVVMFSMVGGMIPGTLFSLAVQLAPSEATISTTVGWMQQWSALGQFVGPPLVGWIASLAGGWHWTWGFTASCCVLGAMLATQLRRKAHRA